MGTFSYNQANFLWSNTVASGSLLCKHMCDTITHFCLRAYSRTLFKNHLGQETTLLLDHFYFSHLGFLILTGWSQFSVMTYLLTGWSQCSVRTYILTGWSQCSVRTCILTGWSQCSVRTCILTGWSRCSVMRYILKGWSQYSVTDGGTPDSNAYCQACFNLQGNGDLDYTEKKGN